MKLEESEEKINEIVNARVKELHNKGQYDLSQSPEEYEKIIQKLEAEVRTHISVQQQMKLYIESYQAKLEENESLEDRIKSYEDEISASSKLAKEYQAQIASLKLDIQAVETKCKIEADLQEQEFSMKKAELEHKVKELESALAKYQSHSRHELSTKSIHNKNDNSVEVSDSRK